MAAALQAAGTTLTGNLALGPMTGNGSSTLYTVQGRVQGRRVKLVGASADGTRLVWLGKATAQGLRGRALLRRPGRKLRGRLQLTRRTVGPNGGGGPAACDNAYFTGEVMPKVLVPICLACHGDGGQAAMTTFRVTPSDPLATQTSVALHIDVANPDASRILRKPLALLPHGGGQRIVAGSPEEQILRHWVDLVAQGVCGGPPGGGPGSGSPEQQLYADNCASCHGDDARGVQGRPDIRCAVKIHDPVRLGRGTGPDAMPPFDNLTDADIATLAGYLAGLCDASGRTGRDLYTSNCSTCHGADARGVGENPNVRCSSDVAEAVRSGKGNGAMPAYATSELSDADVASIRTYLAGLCNASGPAQPADFYLSNCATCHGADARGLDGRPNVRCAVDIHDPVRLGSGTGPDAMPAFAGLSDANIATIASYLGVLCDASGAGRAADLYLSNCASCHGPTGGGGRSSAGVRGPDIQCQSSISEAVRFGEDNMPAFPTFSSADIADMASYLAGYCTGTPGGGGD